MFRNGCAPRRDLQLDLIDAALADNLRQIDD